MEICMSLKNHQYNKILREYDNRQLKSKHDLDQRIKKIYLEIPQIKEMDEQIISNSIACAKMAVMGKEDAIAELKEKNLECMIHKTELLLAHGYPDDYLSLQFQCKDCKDTGYIGNEKCHCFKQAIVDYVYSQSNIKTSLASENFSTFSYRYYSDDYVDPSVNLTPYANMQRVVKSAKNFIKNFDHTYGNILLYGNTGVGKTFLANCIASELLKSGHTVIYLTSFQLFDILEKQAFQKGEDSIEAESQLDYILDCDLLIIDDLGTELNNSFTNTRLYLCINERHLRRKSTLISTNLPLDSIKANYSERIYSRITSNYLYLKIVGEDIRLKKLLS